MKIRSAIPENGCLIFFGGRKKKQKTKKTSAKHIRYRRAVVSIMNHSIDGLSVIVLLMTV